MSGVPPKNGDPPKAGKAEVLAWMAGNSAGYKAGAKHFGLNENLVKQWARREKQAAKVEAMKPKPAPTVARAGKQPAETVHPGKQSSKPMATGSAPALTIEEIDERILTTARMGILRRFARLAQPDSLEGGAQVHLAKAAESIARACPQALALPKGGKKEGGEEIDPSTPEGEAALIAQLRALPPHIRAAAGLAGLTVIEGGRETADG